MGIYKKYLRVNSLGNYMSDSFNELKPGIFFDCDPTVEYSKSSLRCAKYVPRVIIRGVKDATSKDFERTIKTLYEHDVSPENIYLFALEEEQLTPKAKNLFFPACIPNSLNPDKQYGFKQYRDLLTLRKKYRTELVWYLPYDGDGIKGAECKKISREESIELLKDWTSGKFESVCPFPNFDWYFLDGENLSLSYARKYNKICNKKGVGFILGRRVTFRDAKKLLKSKINFLAIRNLQLEPRGYEEFRRIQRELYTAQRIYLSELLVNRIKWLL